MEKDKEIYGLGIRFLEERLEKKGVSKSILSDHLGIIGKNESLNDVYFRLISSGANRGMAWNVITSPIGGKVENLGPVLYDFDPQKVAREYGTDAQKLLRSLTDIFGLKINTADKGLWPQYCRTMLSGARFLSKFSDLQDFQKFVDFFHDDGRARNALPLLLKQEVEGFGLALACDFLKESGYLMFGKPDVHLIAIFSELGLSSNEKDYEVLEAIVRVAQANGVSPYTVDKLFWLIGSGKFYLSKDPVTGKMLKTGRNRDKFMTYVKERIA